MTPDQFRFYLAIEVEAQVEDRFLSAVSVLTGIGGAFAKQGSKTLDDYRRMLQGETAGGGQSDEPSWAVKLAQKLGATRG